MQTAQEIKSLLASRGVSPKRSLGQNFLIDQNLVTKLVDAAEVSPPAVALEVGPGTGTLTEELLARGLTVVACELDDTLVEVLRERLASEIESGQLTIVHGDCLESKRTLNPRAHEAVASAMARLGVDTFSLVANLPYGAATPLISTLLVHHPACRTLAVTVQKEAADRLLAGAGAEAYGPISVLCGALCEGQRVANLPPGCFWPAPKVSSAMAVLHRLDEPLTRDAEKLSRVLAVVFASRRKQLRRVLPEGLESVLAGAGIEPTTRAEALTPTQLVALAEAWPDGALAGR